MEKTYTVLVFAIKNKDLKICPRMKTQNTHQYTDCAWTVLETFDKREVLKPSRP